MDKYYDQVASYIDAHREEMIALWRDLVNMEGSSVEKEHVDKVAKRLYDEFTAAGVQCELVDVGEKSPLALKGIIGADRPGKPVMFGGHYDTVFKAGSFGPNPFKIVDGKAYGPGCLDMKPGIVIALYVIKALESVGFNERPIKIIFAGDEEIGHNGSTARELFKAEGAGGAAAFNMETGLIDDCLCIGRKKGVNFNVKVHGKGAHAGAAFDQGRNAIIEMAHKMLDFAALTDFSKGTTVNCGVIKGGTVSNAVPEWCELEIDARFERLDEIDRVVAAMEELCKKNYIDGTTTTVTYDLTRGFPLFETNEKTLALLDFVNEVVTKHGFAKHGGKTQGGASDAAFFSTLGTPVLCSCGPLGEWNHTDREYAIVDTLFDRAKQIGAVILNLNDFKFAK